MRESGVSHLPHGFCFFQYKINCSFIVYLFKMSVHSYPILSTLTVFTLSHLIMASAISAETVDPVKMVDAFEAAGGKFEGYRRSGAKGICATGEFVGSTEGRT